MRIETDGTPADFERFVGRHAAALQRYARRRTGSLNDADDLVAAALEVAWRRFDSRPRDFELAWLCTIAGKLDANRRRSGARRSVAERRLALEARRAALVAAGATSDLDDRDGLGRALARLSGGDRDVLLLSAARDLTSDQLAHALDVSPAAARRRLSRARARLRHVLAGAGAVDA